MSEEELQDNAETVAKKFAEDPTTADTMEVDPKLGSHSIFVTLPNGPNRHTHTMRIASKYLNDILVRAIASTDAAKQNSFYTQTSNHPQFRGAFGYVFEKFFYVWFLSNSDKTLLCTATKSQRSFPSTCRTRPTAPERFRLEPLGSEKVIIHGGEAGQKGHKTALRHQTPFGWIPSSRSDATFDAVMCTDAHIITFQVTVSAKHTMEPKGFETLRKYLPKTFQDRRHWIHIFVTDHHETAAKLGKTQYTVPNGMKISIYTAVLEKPLFNFTRQDLERIKVLVRPSVSKKILHIHFVTYLGNQDEDESVEMDTDGMDVVANIPILAQTRSHVRGRGVETGDEKTARGVTESRGRRKRQKI